MLLRFHEWDLLLRARNERKLSGSLLISLFLAVLVWVIFYPGTLSADSLYTYNEAIRGQFSDVRPPFITFILHLFLKFNAGLGGFTLLESLLGFLGVRRLLLAIGGSLGIGKSGQDWIASVGLFLLSSPLTPMPVYFITVWFDSWLSIFLLWTLALLMELSDRRSSLIERRGWFKIIAVLLFITLVKLTRWNSVILCVPLVLTFLAILGEKRIARRTRITLALSPLVVYLLFLFFQYQVVGVRRIHTERFAYALDLASMITYDPQVCEVRPLESCLLIQDRIDPMFVVGDGAIDYTMNQGRSIVDPAFAALRVLPSLPVEWRWAALSFPRTFVTVKLLNFADYLTPKPRYFFQSYVHANGFGIHSNEHFRDVRARYVQWLHRMYTHPVFNMFSFAHITWFLINVLGIVYCLLFKRHSRWHRMFGWMLLTPMLYYFSYLIALTSSDFRYMYPSTLLVQVFTFGLAACSLVRLRNTAPSERVDRRIVNQGQVAR